MMEKCANPECSRPFNYRQGRLYCCRIQPVEGYSSTNSHGVHHGWLCGPCSKNYTFEHRAGFGIAITPRSTTEAQGQHSRDLRASELNFTPAATS